MPERTRNVTVCNTEMPPKVPYNDLDPWLWPWTQPRNLDLERRNLTLVHETPCHNECSIFLASVVFELLLKHDFDLWPDHDLVLGRRSLNHVCDTLSHYVLFFCEVSSNLLRKDFDLWPDCDLDLGRRNLNHVRDTYSHYALSFCEVSPNLLQ